MTMPLRAGNGARCLACGSPLHPKRGSEDHLRSERLKVLQAAEQSERELIGKLVRSVAPQATL
jgi:hypothetical protein